MIIIRPSQKCGTLQARRAPPTSPRSPPACPRRTAAMMPAGIPITIPTRIARTRELERDRQPVDDRVRDRQLALVASEVALQREPEPLHVLDRQRLVEAVVVADRRHRRRVAVLARRARSPGRPEARGTPRKTRMLARRRTTRAAPSLAQQEAAHRLSSLLRARLLEAGELRADQAVAVDLHASDGLRNAEPVDRAVQVDQRQVLRSPAREPCGRRRSAFSFRTARALVRRLVDDRVGVAAVVLRALRVDELVEVAVRVDAARPAHRERVELACVGAVEGAS